MLPISNRDNFKNYQRNLERLKDSRIYYIQSALCKLQI